MTWQLNLQPTPDEQRPLYLQIAQAIISDITRGRLSAGQKLPGTRKLAINNDVHRNTIIHAYDELIAQGWLESQPARGTFVCKNLPEQPTYEGTLNTYPQTLGMVLPDQNDLFLPTTHEIHGLPMQGGMPDTNLLPYQLLARAYRRALNRRGAKLLTYGDPRGYRPLRHEIARMLRARRALAVNADNVMMTQGSQMALYLLSQVICADGGIVGVEALGYRPAHAALVHAGATLKSLGLDQDGVQVEQVEHLAKTGNLKAIYLTPHHQYPTMVHLAPDRRLRLLELAAQYNFLIIEDDYDNEFHYTGTPLLPLASADHKGHVAYIGTLSKVLAPGLRKGFIVAPEPLLAKLSNLRVILDRQGDHITEAALAQLMEDDDLASHIRKVQRIYQARRDHLCHGLSQRFEARLQFNIPRGGMALWVEVVPDALGVTSWVRQASRLGVCIRPGDMFRADPTDTLGTRHVRMGFAAMNDAQLDEGIALLWSAWQECGGR